MASLLGSLFRRSRAATAEVPVDAIPAARARLAAPVLAVQRDAVALRFPSGADMFDYCETRLHPCMKNMAMQLPVHDDFLEWSRTGGSYAAARAFFLQGSPDGKREGVQYVVVGIQDSVMVLRPSVLLPLLRVASRCCTGSFTLLLHKVTPNVRALVLPSASRKSDLQAMRNCGRNTVAVGGEKNVLHLDTSSVSTDTYVMREPTTPRTAAVNVSMQQRSRTSLPEMHLLEDALAFCHVSMQFLPDDAVFMEVIGGVGDSNSALSSEETKALMAYVVQDGFPHHPGLGAIMTVHCSVALTAGISLVRFAMQRFLTPIVPSPVLRMFGHHFETLLSRSPNREQNDGGCGRGGERKSTTSAADVAALLANRPARAQQKMKQRQSRVGASSSMPLNPTKRVRKRRNVSISEPLPESDPLSMTLLMVPSRDRDSLLLLLSFLSRLLANVEPRTDFFLMSLVGVFYDVLVDDTHGGNSPLFVAGLVRGYRQLIRAETSRASRSLRRAEGEMRAGKNSSSPTRSGGNVPRRGSVSNVTSPGNRADSAEWKTLSHALKQRVTKLTQPERESVNRMARQLCVLVVPANEFDKVASASAGAAASAVEEDIGSAGRNTTVMAATRLTDTEVCVEQILHALDLTLKQASPLLPSFAWKVLERTPGYFGQDSVSRRYAEARILKDFLTQPRSEILRILSLLSRLLLRESNVAGTASQLPVYRMYWANDAVASERLTGQPGIELIVCRRTLCRILAPPGFQPERVLGVLCTFACWSDALGEVEAVASEDRGPSRLTKSFADFAGLHAEVGLN